MTTSRRSLLLGLGASLVAAPAIVRAASLMPVKSLSAFRWVAYAGGTVVYWDASSGGFFHRVLAPRNSVIEDLLDARYEGLGYFEGYIGRYEGVTIRDGMNRVGS